MNPSEVAHPAPFKRYCKALSLQAEEALLATYRRLHAPGAVWPEITQGMREVGIVAMEIYLLGNQAFMIMDTVPDFDHDHAMRVLATKPRQAEWEAVVATCQQTTTTATAAEKWQLMERIYQLGPNRPGSGALLPAASSLTSFYLSVAAARTNTFAVGLITCLFFLWGFALNLNPILISHLKKACQLTDGQSALIDSASYLTYFLLALPAGQFMKRFGYKGGMLLGLGLFALGALLFYPAAALRSYAFFLGALFVIASGLTFLETAANPYITGLGSPEGATQRLNFAQSFNGLAATLAPLLGGIFILSGRSPSPAQLAALLPTALATYLDHEAAAVQVPYLLIGGGVLLVALLLWRTPLPTLAEETADTVAEDGLWQQKNLLFGVLAQFFYVGAQVCVSSFFIRFAGSVAGMTEKLAAQYLAVALFGFMAGRFLGTVLMRYVPAARLLALYSVLNVGLLLMAATLHGTGAVYALLGVEFFMSIMFPTIFSLGIRGLGGRTKDGSALLIMAIVGGAVLPVVMGHVSDASTIQTAYLVPAGCFLVVLGFALRNGNVRHLALSTAH